MIGFFGTLFVGLALLIGGSVAIAMMSTGTVMPRVSFAGVDVGGLERAAAHDRLAAELPSLSSGSATLLIDGEPVAVPYEQIGRGYELDAMLDAAFSVGRDGNYLGDSVVRLRTLARPTALPLIVHAYDPAAIDAVAADIARGFSREPIAASIAAVDGRFIVSASRDGARIEAQQIRDLLAAAVNSANPDDVTIELSTLPVPASVTTAQAESVAIQARAMVDEPLSLSVADDDPLKLSAKQLLTVVRFGPTDESAYGVRIDDATATKLLQSVADKVARAPKDASFIFGLNGISAVVPALEGRALDLVASTQALHSALTIRAAGGAAPDATLAFSVAQPPLTTAVAEAALPKMRRISSWTTYYVPGVSNYWGANISIPARDIDGKVLAPGEWFDFWQAIGPVSTSRGYGQGGAIIGGRSVPTGAIAGGICSTSTTIFNAALRAGLQMGERRNHYYYIDRYPLGLDATVFQTDGYTLTMTFRNDTADPIVIRSYTGSGLVEFDLWGVPTGRTVSFSKPIVTNPRAAKELTVTSNALASGTRRRVEYAHNGMDVSVTRFVHDAKGALIHQDIYVSAYSAVDGVTEVGPKPAASKLPAAPPSASPSPRA